MPTAAPPVPYPVDLVLHMGSGKTGTSSIQRFMHENRQRLIELGHLYPRSPGPVRHTRLGLFIRPDDELVRFQAWRRLKDTDPAAFRRRFRRELFREIDDSGAGHVIMSDEALYGSSVAALQRLRRFTDRIATNLRLVVYLRRQDDHLVSLYQQEVKAGETRRFAVWAEQDLGRVYDYHKRLSTWQARLQPDALVVRRFERDRFAGGSLFQDFLDAARVPVRATDLQPVESVNESLDADTVEFLRLLNLCRKEEGMERREIDNRSLFARLSAQATGPTLTLPTARLDDFMARWAESNEAVAREFLHDPDGRLFTTERKSSAMTTEQCLDPSRIGSFVELLELSERWHDPLRRVAEREARR